MNVVSVKDYQELSEYTCNEIERVVRSTPHSVLGLATGGTPLGTYREMINGFKERNVDYRHVTTFNLDEYIGLGRDHPQSYYTYMMNNLFKHINVSPENIHIPNGSAEEMDSECLRYERLIEEIGPPDLQILGIGSNGHIGFNEPGTSITSETHIVELAESTRKANARYFSSLDEVPQHAITMGIQSILKSKRILLLASGSHKAKAVKTLLECLPDEQFPASVLKGHGDVTLVVDESAGG
ncbi:glucosamine-6-phosphate deaminase [Rossellomorea sp. SC111]|uniref:glucosamine-6-phosphate deaminase n=1 Tax=Rossellomorea sp. SC111 TaxID=2968985 RepID=UPI00215B2929|nr:glucosamine-6-phosphate deaminase [Rossellomorea sp. SC111]MCR8848178.1 glucosamine-6-phosphate deaminase [Rossellomorea sp. SC111]